MAKIPINTLLDVLGVQDIESEKDMDLLIEELKKLKESEPEKS